MKNKSNTKTQKKDTMGLKNNKKWNLDIEER